MVKFTVIMPMLHLTSSLVLDNFFVMAYATMNVVVKFKKPTSSISMRAWSG